MISILFSALFFWGSFVVQRKISRTKREKMLGVSLLAVSVLCLSLYCIGILGVGVPSIIMDLLGKVGFST